MKKILGFVNARTFTKRLLGWQLYKSYLSKQVAEENAGAFSGASAIIATSWTTLEAAVVMGRASGIPVFWIPLANRVAIRRKKIQFVSANRRRGRRNFRSLLDRLQPMLPHVARAILVRQHPDSPTEAAMLAAGLSVQQIRCVSTINDIAADPLLGRLQGRVICLADSSMTSGGGLSRLLSQLPRVFEDLHVAVIGFEAEGRAESDIPAIGSLSTLFWPVDRYDSSYGWRPALALLGSSDYSQSPCAVNAEDREAAAQDGEPRRDSHSPPQVRSRLARRLIRLERRCVDFLRKRDALRVLRAYFHLRRSHPLEDEIRVFRRNLIAASLGSRFDLVQSIDLISASAGLELAQRSDACHIVDINEFVYLEPRVGWQFRTMGRMHFSRLYDQIGSALHATSGIISNSLGGTRLAGHKFRVLACPVRNLRNAVQLNQKTGAMRSEFSIPQDAVVLVHVCTISHDYKSDIAVRTLVLLPEEFHLVFVGYGNSAAYTRRLSALVHELGLAGRVHFRKDIADEQDYISYVSGGDIGLATLDIESPFVRFNLPNRVCDLLAARLPMVSSYSHEVKHIVKEIGVGVVVKSNDPRRFAESILSLRTKLAEGVSNISVLAATAAQKYTWDTEVGRYFDYVHSLRNPDQIHDVAFVFQRGLIRNRRVLRFAEQYLRRGCNVTIFCGAMPPGHVRAAYPEIQFRQIPTRYYLEARS